MNNLKILIVDDEPFNVDCLEQELEDLNYDLISASNGVEALKKVESESPDLVLLDIMMPVMNGFDVLNCMKSNPGTRDIPVIVISANNDLQSVVQGIKLGAEDYLPKPFESVLLHARISSSLEKKRLRDIQQLYIKSLEREFEIARDIQASFLPAELPHVDGWEMDIYFKAAREVAGDFYDVFLLPNGKLACVVGDVCDKGIGAALFMTLFRSLIHSAFVIDQLMGKNNFAASTPDAFLQKVLNFTNQYVSEVHSESCMFSTVFIGVFDLQDGTLTYANCGNESPLVIENGNISNVLAPTGPVIGVIPGANFIVKETVLAKGQTLLAFTDGIPDALNTENISFGLERLRELLGKGESKPIAMLNSIGTQLSCFIGQAKQFDDITVLAVQRIS